MFCPNCGTQNDSAATPCKKCGFKLSGVSAPKFRGTMVLNSDQTVQELIEEHRRKQAEAEPVERRPRASEPPPPSSGVGAFPASSRGPVLQPPRAAVGSRRRMGGTMLGVAPQAGGVLPPELAAPPAGRPGVSRSETSTPASPPSSAADPLAGTAPLPAMPEPPEPSPPSKPAASALTPPPAPAAAALEAVPAAAPIEAPGEVAAADGPGPAIAPTAALPAHAEVVAAPASAPPAPARLRPLDVALIILTCGLYGLVLWVRQRKSQA